MYRFLFLHAGILFWSLGQAQMRNMDAGQSARFLADKIIENTHRVLTDRETGTLYGPGMEIPVTGTIGVKSEYSRWHYENGVLNMAMFRLGEVLGDPRYIRFSEENYRFIFNHLDYFKKQYDAGITSCNFNRLFRLGSLDNCGTMGAGLIEAYQRDQDPRYLETIERISEYIGKTQLRLEDGTLARDHPRKNTIWGDDLYMSVSFLSRMGALTGNQDYFDDAVRQVQNFTRYLFHPGQGIYYHCYYTDTGKNGVAHWGRANGWVMMAQVELLTYLPASHPARSQLIEILQDFIIGISRFQGSSGMWHQLLDKTDSYEESSVTAMFIYGVAKAVNQGWIDPSYRSIAIRGWTGLYRNITENAQVKDICVGTHIEQDLVFYYNRPKSVNDKHGLAATLLAVAEMVELQRNMK
jgi:unsaturated rhamnogalacturonyl hydrolase